MFVGVAVTKMLVRRGIHVELYDHVRFVAVLISFYH